MTTAAPNTINDPARTIAVIGSTGLVGRQVVELLHASGHGTVQVAQGSGVDMLTGDGLDAALNGADAVIDVISAPTPDDSSEAFFQQTSANLSTVTRSLRPLLAHPPRAARARPGVPPLPLRPLRGAIDWGDPRCDAGDRARARRRAGGPPARSLRWR